MEENFSFGYWLKRQRLARDLRQDELARQLGIATVTLRKIEADARRPSLQLIERLGVLLQLGDDERVLLRRVARADLSPDALALPTAAHHLALPADLPVTVSKPHTIGVAATSLPSQPTPFIGRLAELAALDSLFANAATHLITITGPGGIGKSRLALAAAERQVAAGRFRDGAVFVALAPLSAPEHLSATLAEALGFPLASSGTQTRTPPEQILGYLRTKELLVILDNCEHLLDSLRELAVQILDAAPGVRLLTTSRERLNLQGEQLVPLGGLSAEAAADAAALFTATAARSRPRFRLSAENQADVARICALVGGMPLAIELAASWIDTLALSEIAVEITRDLGLLASEAYDLPERHRSMRAVFDATWQRLDEAERDVFARLAVFRGGCTRPAAQAVAGATLRQLHTLVGKSVLRYRPEDERYVIHELLRQYAAERLAADPAHERATREQHAAHYLDAIGQRAADLTGARQREALDAIEADGENVRVAWAWATAHRRLDLLAEALEPLALFYQWRGRFEEGLAACAQASAALAGLDMPAALLTQARALGWQSAFASALMQIDDAIGLAEQGLAILDTAPLAAVDTRAVRAFLLLRHADVAAFRSVDAAAVEARSSLALARALSDPWAIGAAGMYVALLLSLGGHEADALEAFAECVGVLRGLGDRILRAQALAGLSKAARYSGRYHEAHGAAEECLELGRQLGNPALIAQGHSHLGITVWYLGDFPRAYAHLQESLAICTELGDPDGSAFACNNHYRLCLVLVAMGRLLEAQATAERGLQLARHLGNTIAEGGCLEQLGLFALSQGDAERAHALMSDSAGIMRALGAADELSALEGNLALAEHGLGQTRAARRRLVRSLRNAALMSTPLVLGRLVACSAVLLEAAGQHRRAIELGTLALGQPFVAGSMYRELLAAPLASAAETLPADVVTLVQARRCGGDLVASARELLGELEAAGWGATDDERTYGSASTDET
jgi:predicted ATPase/transcriptional regulator with XRE-family HTH domain